MRQNKFKLNTLASISISNTILALLCGMTDHKLLTLNTKLFAKCMLLFHYTATSSRSQFKALMLQARENISLQQISKNTLIINTTTYAAASTCPHIQL